jgi:hypothetical protein
MAAPLDGKLYVVTAKSTGKARRVRATGRVRFAAGNMSGSRIRSEWQEGDSNTIVVVGLPPVEAGSGEAVEIGQGRSDRPPLRGDERGPGAST